MAEEQNKMPDVIWAGFVDPSTAWAGQDTVDKIGLNWLDDGTKYIRADLVDQLTKTPENVTCAAVSNAGESMVPDGFMIVSEDMWNDLQKQVSRNGDAHLSALNFYNRITAGCDLALFSQQDFKDDQTIRAVLQTPSVCTHSGDQPIETEHEYMGKLYSRRKLEKENQSLLAITDALADAAHMARHYLELLGNDRTDANATCNKITKALGEYNNFKQGNNNV